MIAKGLEHIFFDLDNTIWDFEASSNEAFRLMFDHFRLAAIHGLNLTDFSRIYHQHNDALWALYREGKIQKEDLRSKRFRLTLESFGIFMPGLDEQMSDFYLWHAPRIVRLEPYAIEVLEYLCPKYRLHLITNGFAEVQYTKVKEAGLEKYFEHIITSEEAGVKKPEPGIFALALQRAGAEASNSLMVGDDPEVDVEGAMAFGLNAVYYNARGRSTSIRPGYEIRSLKELMSLL
ncbi:MAG: noncanonical pyrimidine nucleotidase, YjjG family [Bacteroidetes bacterium]|nr:noncanonical pyrimidine nucleotidase, YjjG family [Bacteroidota bacterium]